MKAIETKFHVCFQSGNFSLPQSKAKMANFWFLAPEEKEEETLSIILLWKTIREELFMFVDRIIREIIIKLSLSLDSINVSVMQRIIHTLEMKLGVRLKVI